MGYSVPWGQAQRAQSASPSERVGRSGRNAPHAAGEPGRGTLGPARGEVAAMVARLFVGNLSFQATEEDGRELFQHAGTLGSVHIVTDHLTGRSRGFGFVEMATREAAVEAIKMLNGRLFLDRHLVVDEARPQPQRGRGGLGPPTSGAGGGGGWRGR